MTVSPSADLSILSDLCTPWCLRVAVTLRIAERITGGTTGVDALAASAGCDVRVLRAVLEHLVTRGVFDSPEPGRFTVNDVAARLMDPQERIGLDLDGIGGRMAHAWSTLPSFVRTGRPAYRDVFGRPFWEDLDAHPEVAASFDELIGAVGHGRPDAAFDVTGGWDAVRTVVDVGGGTGGMLAEILRMRPHVRGTLVDLPRAVASSAATFDAAGVSDRVTRVGQSFFEPLPPGADLYVVRGVLNDWPDGEATAILERCAAAARPDGRVVVLKSVSDDTSPRPLAIEMVLLGGHHRTVDEFAALAGTAGLEVVQAARQRAHFVVECRPA